MNILYVWQKQMQELFRDFAKAKTLFIVTFLLMAHDGRAAYQGQIVITPIDARSTPVFICNGVRQNWLQLDYNLV